MRKTPEISMWVFFKTPKVFIFLLNILLRVAEKMDSSDNNNNNNIKDGKAVDDLLEECWFFDNLLMINKPKPKKIMSRCYSDPCPTSSNHFTKQEKGRSELLMSRQLSDQMLANEEHPMFVVKEGSQAKEGDGSKSGDRRRRRRRSKVVGMNLKRTLTLPSYIGREAYYECGHGGGGGGGGDMVEEGESDARMSKLMVEALANSKVPPTSFTTPKHRPPKSPEPETVISNSNNNVKETRRRYLTQKTLRKSLTDLEFEEVQGFKDLGFTFEEQDLSPDVVHILPGLQDKKQEKSNKNDKMMMRSRPYLSEAWLELQSYTTPPPIPSCLVKNSSDEMKTQIKFWARAVATNVRQEC